MATTETPQELFLQNIHKTVFVVDRLADQILSRSFNATFSQFLLLTAVNHCPGLSQQSIATFLNLSPAAISRQVDNLEAAGYIVRAEDPESRRSHTVDLTPKGIAQHAAMKKTLLHSFGKQGAVSDEEFRAANAVLSKMLALFAPEKHI